MNLWLVRRWWSHPLLNFDKRYMLFRNAGGQKFLPGTESIECVEELNECLYIPPTHHPLLNVLNLNITYKQTNQLLLVYLPILSALIKNNILPIPVVIYSEDMNAWWIFVYHYLTHFRKYFKTINSLCLIRGSPTLLTTNNMDVPL